MENDNQLDNPERRRLITTAGAAAVVAGVNAVFGTSHAQSGRKPHVIIVGAGLAGLCAAYGLQKNGWSYTILEADARHVGGRVRTLRFPDGNYWEAGAMRIPKCHNITRRYIKTLGLEDQLRPFVMYSKKTFFYARKTRSVGEGGIKDQYFLAPDEKSKSSEDLWKLSVKNIVAAAQNADALINLNAAELKELQTENAFKSSNLLELDRRSLRQLINAARPKALNGAPLSDEAVEFMLFAYGNLAIQHAGATEFLREESLDVWDSFSEIKGGTWRLPHAFLSCLRTRPRMGCEVVGIEQDKKHGRVSAIYMMGGRKNRVEGDFLICTIPLPALARVAVNPPLSNEKRRAILEVGYDSGTKVALLTKNRFWELNNQIYGGSSTTDLISGAIVYPSDNAATPDGDKPCDEAKSHKPGVLLASYCWGQDARRLAALPKKERVELVRKNVSNIHPELKPEMIIDSATWAWDTHRWSGGAFAWYHPGQFTSMHEHVIAADDRIHFAGEHCSHSHTWMEGALESAEKVVEQLLKKE